MSGGADPLPAGPVRDGLRDGPVLVTGAAGFIGSNLADRLAAAGHDVVAFDALTRRGVEANLAWLRDRHPRRIRHVHADVRDAAAVAKAAKGAGAVFHLAAQVAVTTSMVAPVDDFETNLRGTLNLLEALRRRGDGTPLIFASTNKVYGDLADIALGLAGDAWQPRDANVRAHGVGEDRPLDFHTPYGCSKGGADQYVLDYGRSFGVPTAVMRMSCIYGPRQMGTEDQGWVAHFLIRALGDEPITIFGDGRQVRDILYVDDAVDAYLAAWRRIDRVRGRAFNLGGGAANAVSLRQLLGHVETLAGRPIVTEFRDWRPGDQRYYVSDTRAVRRTLGLAEPLPWRAGVERLAKWLGESGRAAAPRKRRAAAAATPAPARSPAPPPAPRRLLMTTDAVGGVWTYALDLARALAPHGLQTTLAVLGPPPSDVQAAEARQIRDLDLLATGLPLDWTAAGEAEITAAAAALAEIARGCSADIVQLNSPTLAAGADYPAPVLGVCHSCLATWWEAVRGGDLPPDFRWRAALHARGLRACAGLVAPTRAFAAATARVYDLPLPATVHNGRRPAPPAPVLATTASRDRQVFTAGRLWDEGKDLATLDAAAALIDAPLYAAGPLDGPNGARARLAAARSLGALPEPGVRAWLARTPVFASAARYEPFGLTVLEAAQAGCALVLADLPTFRELWHDAAAFVPAGDAPAFAAVLQALLDAPERAAEQGAAARARAEAYSLEAMAEAMLARYRALLARRPARKGAEAAA